MQLLTLSTFLFIANLAAASPAASKLEARQCSGPKAFRAGDCAYYATDSFNLNANCADMCIAEATRQGCCDPLAAQWQLVKGDCSLDASTCECTC